jgi:hypothetical protein
LRYTCMRATIDYGAPVCLSLSGAFLDDFVVAQLMAVLQPASLELSLAAEHALRAERTQLERHWHQRLDLLYLWHNLLFINKLRAKWSSNRATRCAEISGALGVP